MKVTSKSAAPKITANRSILLDFIVRSKELQYRAVDPAHVDSLAADIAVNGLDVPIITFSHSEGEMIKLKGNNNPIPATYLVAGSHRVEALKKIRRENPDAFKKFFPTGEIPTLHRVYTNQEALFALLRENVQRREMSAEEIFPVLEKLTSEPFNLKGKEIAKHIGKSPAWVSQHLAVTEVLDEDTQAEVLKGEIAVADARKLAADVRADRKGGKDVSKEDIRAKATTLKEKQANKAATGAQRSTGEDRRVSAKKLLGRWKAQTNVGLARSVVILQDALSYLAGETDKLPAELRHDPKPSKVEAKPVAKKPAAKKAA